jgi:hypothetical protein
MIWVPSSFRFKGLEVVSGTLSEGVSASGRVSEKKNTLWTREATGFVKLAA